MTYFDDALSDLEDFMHELQEKYHLSDEEVSLILTTLLDELRG